LRCVFDDGSQSEVRPLECLQGDVVPDEGPPPDALEWERNESPEGFLVFTPPRMRKPRTLQLEVRGFLTKLRINALWNGCAFVV